MKVYSITDYGACADGETDDSDAIQHAIDACFADGGGRVLIPPGSRVRAGSFQLRSDIDLHVAEEAVLISATTLEAFRHRVFTFGPEADKRYWIGCKDAVNVTLSGKGTIDGQCRAFALEETADGFSKTYLWRPAMTCFENVRRIVVRDLTFRDAANWTLHFTGCSDVDVHDVKIFNNLKFPNADGIDPDHCQNVRISRCHIVSADDCIVLKNTAPFAQYGPCEDIEITDCRLESVSAAFKIGSESVDAFRRIRMSRCVIERSNRGLAIQLRDGGSVEDVVFSDIQVETKRFAPMWWGAGEAIYVTALRRNSATVVGTIKNVVFENIRCTGENGIVIYAEPDGNINNVILRDVSVTIQPTTTWPSGLFDLRPCEQGFLPPQSTPLGEDTPWGRPATRECAGISLDGSQMIEFAHVDVKIPTEDSVPWRLMRVNGSFTDNLGHAACRSDS